jgi:hypothetical protein
MFRRDLTLSELEARALQEGISADAALSRYLRDKAYSYVPEGYGECPACEGSGLERERRPYRSAVRCACTNCGGQTMSGGATGLVPLRRDSGEPCVHEYDGRSAGRCYRVFTCKHCGFSYDEDSGD